MKNLLVNWVEFVMGDLGFTYGGLTGKTKVDFGNGKPYITYMNIFSNNQVNKNQFGLVTIEENELQNKVEYGDILFTTSSETPDEVGMSSVVLHTIDETYLNSFCFGFRLNNFNHLLPQYAKYLFRGDDARKVITILAQGSTRFNLSKNSLLRKLKLNLPPLLEQQKIAEILTTVDDKIDIINTQIIQTQELKKGLMQQLLTKGIGHTKFKDSVLGEIPENWEVKTINEFVVDFKGGASLTPSDFVENNGFPVIPKKSVTDGGKLNIDCDNPTYCSNSFAESNRNNIVNNHFIITSLRDLVPSGPNIGYMVSFVKDESFILAQGVYGFVVNDLIDKQFLIQYSNTDIFRKVMQRIMVGSTQVHIRNQDYFKVEIPYPPIAEQKKIASIICVIYEKLEILKDKKEYYEVMKKALMQQLLTGKIRVKI